MRTRKSPGFDPKPFDPIGRRRRRRRQSNDRPTDRPTRRDGSSSQLIFFGRHVRANLQIPSGSCVGHAYAGDSLSRTFVYHTRGPRPGRINDRHAVWQPRSNTVLIVTTVKSLYYYYRRRIIIVNITR